MRALALGVSLLVALWCARAEADADADADADLALRAAIARSQRDVAGALADLEALGARRPVTRWTDNAWSEAARLAEAAKDFARARRALEQVIALDEDAALVRRARATLERLASTTGDGRWDEVAREHERLVSAIAAGGDPRSALGALADLVRANPGYPRATAVRTAIARGWELEGDADTALAWMRAAADAAGPDERGQRTRLELTRLAIRGGALDVAAAELAALRGDVRGVVDRAALADVEAELATAHARRWLRRGVAALLALLGIGAALTLRRDTGAWAAAARRIARPPIEVLFLAPLAGLVVGVAATGNPLVARAIITITVAGVGVAWVSGVLIDVARERARRTRGRLVVHVMAVALAVAGVVWLAVDRDGVLRLLLETWRGGHALD